MNNINPLANTANNFSSWWLLSINLLWHFLNSLKRPQSSHLILPKIFSVFEIWLLEFLWITCSCAQNVSEILHFYKPCCLASSINLFFVSLYRGCGQIWKTLSHILKSWGPHKKKRRVSWWSKSLKTKAHPCLPHSIPFILLLSVLSERFPDSNKCREALPGTPFSCFQNPATLVPVEGPFDGIYWLYIRHDSPVPWGIHMNVDSLMLLTCFLSPRSLQVISLYLNTTSPPTRTTHAAQLLVFPVSAKPVPPLESLH